MNRRIAIAAAAAFALTGLGVFSGSALARDCGWRCANLVQARHVQESDRPRPPLLRAPGRDAYGGPSGERSRTFSPQRARQPLADGQIWAIAQSRVPGRIVKARLHGHAYSFRIISTRGNIVDVVVDRYSGRVLSVRGGP